MLRPEARERISRIVGRESCSDRREDTLLYAYDAMNRRFLPEMVAHPAGARQVSEILSLANESRFPVVPRGAGTGFTGGSLAVTGGLVVTTLRMNRILAVDDRNLTVKAEAGVVNGDLQEVLSRKDLFFPPDPSSFRFSTLGGNAAENAGGPRAVKYGVTRDYVMGLTAVLPTGDIIRTGSDAPKSVTGYDLTRLLVGSEGTLAFLVDLTLKVLPLPEDTRTSLAVFPRIEQAAETVAAIMAGRILPSALEFMDRTAVRVVEDYLHAQLPVEAAAILLIEVDGPSVLLEQQTGHLEDICRRSGASRFTTARTQEERETLWKARRSISPALMKVRSHKINEDVAVPRTRIPDLIRGVEELARKRNLAIVNFGHAGDGNVHVNILYNEEDAEEAASAREAAEELFALTLSLGGTLSGEHGIGIAKAPFLGMELSPATLALMRRVKAAFDPNNILNPGKTFDFGSPGGGGE